VAAYQAAGNVTFRTENPVDEAEIESALTTAYGFETAMFVRSASEIAAIASTSRSRPRLSAHRQASSR
jgi:uncharacterized protein (DUF1697 family)